MRYTIRTIMLLLLWVALLILWRNYTTTELAAFDMQSLLMTIVGMVGLWLWIESRLADFL